MNKSSDFETECPVSEMLIVDTFTKLIFGEEGGFSSSEERIIRAFRQVDTSVALDTQQEMGQYLRVLGVNEMIKLVSQVQSCLADGLQALVRVRGTSALDRRAH